MKVICKQENLKNGLMVVGRIVGSSSTLPILNNVLLETDNGQLKISSTNLEIGISTYIRCKIEIEGGVCVSAKTLIELINNLPNDNITISTDDVETSVSTANYNTKIKHLPKDDFPIIPNTEDGFIISVDSKDLADSLDQVSFAVSNTDTQPEISGIGMFISNKKMVLVATDRYRLAEKTISINGSVSKNIIVPAKSINEISRLISGLEGDLEFKVSDTQLSVNINDTYLVTRLIDGNYPDYEQIIPDNHNIEITIEKNPLTSALKTSGIFSKGAGSVTMVFDDEKQILQVSSVSLDIGESVVDVPCSVEGESCSVIMNYRYVQDVLSHIDSKNVKIYIIDNSSPVVFKLENSNNYLYLVMPIRT